MTPTETRSFRVQLQDGDGPRARIVEEPSFEAAAIAYIEDHHVLPADGDEVRIVVRDLADGREHCFRIDLGTGETAPCG